MDQEKHIYQREREEYNIEQIYQHKWTKNRERELTFFLYITTCVTVSGLFIVSNNTDW